MKTLQIHASKTYPVIIGTELMPKIAEYVLQTLRSEKICIVSDTNVWPLHGMKLEKLLQFDGSRITSFVFPAGESSKNMDTYTALLHVLASHRFTRSDCIIALGGGVVGDLAGFAAATYLRGIPYVQVPTSLLAMVDSSVGGKTGIDLPTGKNLCGTVWQPSAVFCDMNMLDTLPEDPFVDGCAEIIKYAVLYDRELFSHLREYGTAFSREYVIARCVAWKKQAVEADEYDLGARRFLNFGHTVGHAIEKRSGYTISHGKAVAIGMSIMCRAAGCGDTPVIVSLLDKFRLPTKTVFSAAQLAETALSDKKRSGGRIDLILPGSIGNCRIVPTPVDALQAFIGKGL